jgi:hypothetical protein
MGARKRERERFEAIARGTPNAPAATTDQLLAVSGHNDVNKWDFLQ